MIDTTDFCHLAAIETGIPIQDVRLIVQSLTRQIQQALLADEAFLFRGLGVFRVIRQVRKVRHHKQKHRPDSYVRVSFRKSAKLRQLFREQRQTGEIVEKYGVDEGQDESEAKKLASANCPKCGTKVEQHGKTTWCPKCGTEPFESK